MKLILMLSLSLGAPAAHAASSAQEVRAVIEPAVTSVLDVLRDKKLSKEAGKKKVIAIVDKAFDLALMGKLALGRARWPELSKGQQKEFTETFIKTIQDSYYDKLQLYTDETVTYEEPAPGEKGKYVMNTLLVSKGQRYTILYKLYRGPSSWRVYDIEIQGVSLVKTYGSQYDQFLQKSSIDKLLAKMKEKTLDTPEDLKKAGK